MSERFTLDVRMDMPKLLIDNNTNEKYHLLMVNDIERIVGVLNDQSETIRKQSIRIYCQDKEIQRLLGELEKIPKSIREVWLEE